ncbi:acyltransferase family protein [Veronia nyctiphanis]|uniref:acyltransferase family protein n=1 Tax=Veronia nyctiphanis TaxID=1278244 RepID=UPI002E2578F8
MAGFFCGYLLHSRVVLDVLKNRTYRLLLPYLVGVPFIVVGPYLTVDFWGDKLVHVPFFFTLVDEGLLHLNSGHLWFLFNLYEFILLLLLLFCLKIYSPSITKLFVHPVSLLLLVPVSILPALMTEYIPFRTPDSLYPQLWSFGLYGILFFIGACLYHHQSVINRMVGWITPLLILGVSGSVIYCLAMPAPATKEEMYILLSGDSLMGREQTVLLQILQCFLVVYLSYLALALGKKYWSNESQVMRYCADASYWVYLVHIPIIVNVQLPMIDLMWSAWIKLLITLTVTLSVSFASYHFCVRYTWIGRWLNGERKKVSTSVPVSS